MATKETRSLFKQQSFFHDQSHTNYSNQSLNLNLNQCPKGSDIVLPVHSYSNSNNDKSFGHTVTDAYNESKKSWNKTSKELCFKTSKNACLNGKIQESQKRWKNDKNVCSSLIKSSTLSLHIAAYENSVVASNGIEDSPKIFKASKSINSSSKFQTYQDFFEFPRQQESTGGTPAIQQFKASQKLFSPNQSSASSRTELPGALAGCAVNLKNAHADDTKLVKSRISSTIRAAMDPTNPNYMITSIKLDFSHGPLLYGDDSRYMYRSPEMTIEAIPIGPSPDSESDVSFPSETINSGTRNFAGNSNAAYMNDSEGRADGGEDAASNPSLLNAMADELAASAGIHMLTTENAYEIYRAYLEANDLTEDDYPFLPDDNGSGNISQDDIVKWIEDGEKGTISVPQKASRDVTSMNSFSTLESVTSSSTLEEDKNDYGIREIAYGLNDFADDDTLEDAFSLSSADDSGASGYSDFLDAPIRHTPHPDGLRQDFVEGK